MKVQYCVCRPFHGQEQDIDNPMKCLRIGYYDNRKAAMDALNVFQHEGEPNVRYMVFMFVTDQIA